MGKKVGRIHFLGKDVFTFKIGAVGNLKYVCEIFNAYDSFNIDRVREG